MKNIDIPNSPHSLVRTARGMYQISGYNTETNPTNVFSGMRLGAQERLDIHFQQGPVINGVWNGITSESLLMVVLDRLESLQAGEYPCIQNEEAITGVKLAIASLLDPTSPVFSNSVVTTTEDSISRLKSIFENWSEQFTDNLNALELLLAEYNIQMGGLGDGRKSLIFKYINDPEGEWWTVNVDEICEPSRTKWQLSGDGRTTMVNRHPIFNHEFILSMVATLVR